MAIWFAWLVLTSPNDAASGARAAYESFEYEACVAIADQAFAAGVAAADERTMLDTYRGLALFTLGRVSEADVAFSRALAENPDIALPDDTSPKIVARFEALRRAAYAAKAPAPVTAIADAPVLSRNVAPFITGGATLAAGAVGLVMALRAQSARSDAEDATVAIDARRYDDSARSRATVANVAFVSAGVLAATTVVVWLLTTP